MKKTEGEVGIDGKREMAERETGRERVNQSGGNK